MQGSLLTNRKINKNKNRQIPKQGNLQTPTSAGHGEMERGGNRKRKKEKITESSRPTNYQLRAGFCAITTTSYPNREISSY
jgi:hypothetical protein